jgi:endoglycosylceramidase
MVAPKRRAGFRLTLNLLLACAALTGCIGGSGGSEPLALPRLHAEPDPTNGGRIVDARGREVLLRGVNVNALAEYWKGTRFPTTFPLAADDPARIRAIGWNAVRLLVSWSRVEPEPGRYDERYIDRVADAIERLRRAGIYSIVDFHQDAWGPETAARPDERCRGPAEPGIGWDGAPGWATLDHGLPRCTSGARELNPATMRAWEAFFSDEPAPDGVGVQTRYVAMLAHVAARFASAPEVAGYDLMNEPNAFTPADNVRLSTMYSRAVIAIRRAERGAGGFSHLILFEPSALFSATGSGAPPRFSDDRNLVYAPHIYTGGFTGGPITRDAFEAARREADALGGVPIISGEWGADPQRASRPGDDYFVAHQRLQDEFRTGATLWTWRESCGDPHKVADLRAGRVPDVWGEFDVDCRTNAVRGTRGALIAQLRRAYVRAAPGRLLDHRSDRGLRLLHATGRAPARPPAGSDLLAFIPAASAGEVDVVVGGLGPPVVRRVAGAGLLVTAEARGGPWTITVRRADRP